ncbi:hypothetical protein FNAPI_3231 [Fusarium napiforme]|uniref:Uncharacterized protein n=1 Tax=Fusarium napiforme TaxID=42672 RepID=A0A8H5JV20_9HYPO|nr:hypothetical protein FNAPI_3231 [Fusarium napiforme]
MGDPFSIATGVAGLVSLGITVCGGLHTYFSAIKDRKDDLAIVTQNVALFKFHISAVQFISSKLGHHHSLAIDGLQLSLINCELQLKCLEELLNKLRPVEDMSLAKDIWRKQKLIVRYPFDRKKLVQLEEYLSRANTTLSSFIQALNLDELEAFRTYIEARDINTQTSLRTITTRLDVIGPQVEPSTLQLLPSGIEDLKTSRSNSIVLHQTSEGVAKTKTCFSGIELSFQDLNKTHSTPRYLQNAALERRLCEKLADMDYYLADSVLEELRAIYGSGKASPFDVDQDGNNVAHMCLKLLLEADCKVTVGYRWPSTLAGCSMKARKLCFKHLKDRRQRLRNVALSILPEKVLRQYGVATSPLPDKTAFLLWRELHRAKDQHDHLEWVPDSLNPSYNGYFMPASLFEFPQQLQIVELALDHGFAPGDENGVPTLLSGTYIPTFFSPRDLEVSMKYLDWLLRQNLSPELSLEPFRFSILHRIAIFIGDLISNNPFMPFMVNRSSRHICIPKLLDSWTLLPAICDNKARCNIPCPCSSGMFTRPLAHVLPALLRRRCERQFGSFFSRIGENIKLVCAIHILTMMSLEDSIANEDWKEILDEDRELIDQLEALDEEFGVIFDRRNVSISEFLSGYWLTKMEEVVRELNKPLSADDRYNLLEAGVVLDKRSHRWF